MSEIMQINQLRNQIDCLDNKIIELLEQRMQIAKQIGKLKNKLGHPITNPQREEEILQRLSEHSSLSYEQIRLVYQSIFHLTKSLQESK